MIAANETIIAHPHERFSHDDACKFADLAEHVVSEVTIVLDLSRAHEAATSAFARLVLLRRELLRRGRDLRLAGMRDRVAGLYQINRLDSVLPGYGDPRALRVGSDRSLLISASED